MLVCLPWSRRDAASSRATCDVLCVLMNDDWAQEIGKRIADAREKVGLSQPQLADLVGVHKQTIGNYERGTHKPSLKLLPLIAEATNEDLRWLVHGETYRDPLIAIAESLQRLETRLASLDKRLVELETFLEELDLRAGDRQADRPKGGSAKASGGSRQKRPC